MRGEHVSGDSTRLYFVVVLLFVVVVSTIDDFDCDVKRVLKVWTVIDCDHQACLLLVFVSH